MGVFVLSLLSYDNLLSGQDDGYSVRPIAPVDYFPSLMQILARMLNPANVHIHLADYQSTHHLAAHFDEQAEAS